MSSPSYAEKEIIVIEDSDDDNNNRCTKDDSAQPKIDIIDNGREHDSNYIVDNNSTESVLDSFITGSHVNGLSTFLEGNRVDEDGNSLHTDDTDVESYYTVSSDLEWLDQPPYTSDIERLSDVPKVTELPESWPSKDMSAHCQACDRLDWGWMVQCDKRIHGKREGWYHFECAGLTWAEFSTSRKWVCPDCRLCTQVSSVAKRVIVKEHSILTLKSPSKDSANQSMGPHGPAQHAHTASGPIARSSPATPKGWMTSAIVGTTNLYNLSNPGNQDPIRSERKSGRYETDQHVQANTRKSDESTFTVKASDIASVDCAKELHKRITNRRYGGPAVKAKWDNLLESQRLAVLMKQLLRSLEAQDVAVKETDQKWKVLAERLQKRHGYQRTPNSIKNYWQRTGRARYGIDERVIPKPDRMRYVALEYSS